MDNAENVGIGYYKLLALIGPKRVSGLLNICGIIALTYLNMTYVWKKGA